MFDRMNRIHNPKTDKYQTLNSIAFAHVLIWIRGNISYTIGICKHETQKVVTVGGLYSWLTLTNEVIVVN